MRCRCMRTRFPTGKNAFRTVAHHGERNEIVDHAQLRTYVCLIEITIYDGYHLLPTRHTSVTSFRKNAFSLISFELPSM